MSSTLYSTAENPAGSLAQRLHFQRLEGARGPIGAMAGIAIAVAVLIAVGNAFGVLISNTDSAAPGGVYRVVSAQIPARRSGRRLPADCDRPGRSGPRISAHRRVRWQRGAGRQDRGRSCRGHRRDRTRMGCGERRAFQAQRSCSA